MQFCFPLSRGLLRRLVPLLLLLLPIAECWNTDDDIVPNFIFGDSLVDAGNNNFLISLSKANYPPNGIDFPTHTPTGRYTNGRTIADIIGQNLGLPFVPPFLAPTTGGPTLLLGVNYASGGGGILNETGSIFGGRISMDAQIGNFVATRRELILNLGEARAVKLLRRAIFSITFGSNDFINNYLVPIFSIPERAVVSPESFIDTMTLKYREQLTKLYQLDARKIVIANVGPIGCIPYMREISGSAGEGCVEFPDRLAQSFNGRLRPMVNELNSNLPGAIFLYADVYRIVSDIIKNYEHYGFEVADLACCAVAGRFGGLVPCGPTSRFCSNRTRYVFWDPYHPTDAANTIIAHRLLDGGPADISPINIRQLLAAA